MDWKLTSSANLNSSFALFNAADTLMKKAHLARAEAMLISADTSALTHRQKLARKNTVEELHRYRERGVFAMNEEVPGYSSVFKDRQGTLCAVAHLVYSSGHEDLVEKVASEDNFLTLSETETHVLDPWLEESGITYEEAAVIQVPSFMRGDITNIFQVKAQAAASEKWLGAPVPTGKSTSYQLHESTQPNVYMSWFGANALTVGFILTTSVLLAGTMLALYLRRKRIKNI